MLSASPQRRVPTRVPGGCLGVLETPRELYSDAVEMHFYTERRCRNAFLQRRCRNAFLQRRCRNAQAGFSPQTLRRNLRETGRAPERAGHAEATTLVQSDSSCSTARTSFLRPNAAEKPDEERAAGVPAMRAATRTHTPPPRRARNGPRACRRLRNSRRHRKAAKARSLFTLCRIWRRGSRAAGAGRARVCPRHNRIRGAPAEAQTLVQNASPQRRCRNASLQRRC